MRCLTEEFLSAVWENELVAKMAFSNASETKLLRGCHGIKKSLNLERKPSLLMLRLMCIERLVELADHNTYA